MERDFYLDFYKIHSIPIGFEDCERPVLLILDYNALCVMNAEDLFAQRFLPRDLVKTVLNIDLTFYNYGNTLVYPFETFDVDLHAFNYLKNFCHIMSFTTREYRNSTLICKLNRIENDYFVDFYVRRKILDNVLMNKRDYKINAFQRFYEKFTLEKKTDEIQRALESITNSTASEASEANDVFEPAEPILNIKLFSYQKNDIAWLKSIKNDIDNNNNLILHEYHPYSQFDYDNTPVFYYSYTFVKHLNNSLVYRNVYNYRGANLISEMGLGKSLVMLYFLLEHSPKSNFVLGDAPPAPGAVDAVPAAVDAVPGAVVTTQEPAPCNYFYKRGKFKKTHCKKAALENQLFCKEHNDTLFIDKTILRYRNLDRFVLGDFIRDRLFQTNASVIVAPSHVCDQWVREYYTKFVVKRRVILLVTFDQYTNLTLGDLLFADLIVVSYNFLINSNYIDLFHTLKRNVESLMSRTEIDDPLEILNSTDYSLLSKFKFKSVVLDEFHEILRMPKSSYIEYQLKEIVSDYRWNISGTPFANGLNGFLAGINYICPEFDTRINKYTSLPGFLESGIDKELVHQFGKLYRRNTKQSIAGEYTGNIITEKVKMLEFTEQERNIYDSYVAGHPEKNYQFLIQLCCDPEMNMETQVLIKNCKTFDEIQRVLLDHNKQKLDEHIARINQLTESISFLTVQANAAIDEEIKQDYLDSITVAKRNLTNERKLHVEIKRIYDFLSNVVDNLTKSETCPICLDDIENIAVTKCGHKFCWECIDEFIKVFKATKCPKCNVPIILNDIFLLKRDAQPIEDPQVSELNKLVQEVRSTKLGNVIYYLQNELTEKDKCIVFSQWDPLLHKLGGFLERFKTKIVYCDGTVYQRKKAISSFSSDAKDAPNIIMLSSQNAASGINLTAANKILLLEPVYGTKEYRQAIENQAIARSDRLGQTRPIEVVRFIIKDTIEQQLTPF